MSKILFSEDDIVKLKDNIYVKAASPKGIIHTDEFKVLFIAELYKGKVAKTDI